MFGLATVRTKTGHLFYANGAWLPGTFSDELTEQSTSTYFAHKKDDINDIHSTTGAHYICEKGDGESMEET